MLKKIEKLTPLTSLRFIAAIMIAVGHSYNTFLGSFSFFAKHTDHIVASLFQGVSFFFVLSGFILAYVYPKLLRRDIPRFLWARFARIWPAHIFGILLFLLLLNNQGHLHFYVWILNILMLQSWVPNMAINFSLNGVSWSISTEFFFYFCFIWLIYKLSSTWFYKLLLAFSMLLAMILFCNILHLPYPLYHPLVLINPLSRLFEFTVGMCMTLIFKRVKDRNISFFYGTSLEILMVTLTLFGMYLAPVVASRLQPYLGNSAGNAAQDWITYCGPCVLFGLLITTMALQSGFISKILSLRFFVLLGEISYALYLVHFTILGFFQDHMKSFEKINILVLYGFFWAICITLAYLTWQYFEKPMRRLLVNLPAKYTTLRSIYQ